MRRLSANPSSVVRLNKRRMSSTSKIKAHLKTKRSEQTVQSRLEPSMSPRRALVWYSFIPRFAANVLAGIVLYMSLTKTQSKTDINQSIIKHIEEIENELSAKEVTLVYSLRQYAFAIGIDPDKALTDQRTFRWSAALVGIHYAKAFDKDYHRIPCNNKDGKCLKYNVEDVEQARRDIVWNCRRLYGQATKANARKEPSVKAKTARVVGLTELACKSFVTLAMPMTYGVFAVIGKPRVADYNKAMVFFISSLKTFHEEELRKEIIGPREESYLEVEHQLEYVPTAEDFEWVQSAIYSWVTTDHDHAASTLDHLYFAKLQKSHDRKIPPDLKRLAVLRKMNSEQSIGKLTDDQFAASTGDDQGSGHVHQFSHSEVSWIRHHEKEAKNQRG